MLQYDVYKRILNLSSKLFHSARNKVWNSIIEQKTMNDIGIGELLIALKQLVKKSMKKDGKKTTWIVWVQENIP